MLQTLTTITSIITITVTTTNNRSIECFGATLCWFYSFPVAFDNVVALPTSILYNIYVLNNHKTTYIL